jgi:tetratricopeptide (TPR) repeat protein
MGDRAPARDEERWPTVGETPAAYELFHGGCWFLRHRHPNQAAMLLEHAKRLAPGKYSICEALGRAYFALGKHDLAAEEFAGIVAAVPVNDYAHYGLGRALLHLGRRREALAHLRLAAAMVPAKKAYQEALDDSAAGADQPADPR